jgi:hypothetical protein
MPKVIFGGKATFHLSGKGKYAQQSHLGHPEPNSIYCVLYMEGRMRVGQKTTITGTICLDRLQNL